MIGRLKRWIRRALRLRPASTVSPRPGKRLYDQERDGGHP